MDGRRIPRLSLDLLRGFHAAARHLSFTRAAQELFVTQPAVSREIKTLESQLGRPLFRRVNRGLELTPAGRELFEAVDAALAGIDAAALRIAGQERALSVTTTVALASTWLVSRLPRFAQAHPEVEMRFAATNDQVDLERARVDVAIRFAPAGTPAPSSDKLFDYLQFPVCAPAIADDPSRPLRVPADLSRHVLLDFETTVYGRTWSDWQRWCAALGRRAVEGSGALRFAHYDQVIEAALEGSGVAIGKLPHLTKHLRQGVLVAPLGRECVAQAGAFYVEVADHAPFDVADAFVRWLHEQADDDARQPAPIARS